MIVDGIPFLSVMRKTASTFSDEVARRIVATLERTLGVRVMYESSTFPNGDDSLSALMPLLRSLLDAGILKSYGKQDHLPDEPAMHSWYGICGAKEFPVGGASFLHESDAVSAMLSEALERYLWSELTDHFRAPIYATAEEISRRGAYIAPERFAGFSPAQRAHTADLRLRSDASYLWIYGTSLMSGRSTYIPAQTASGAPFVTADGNPEPLIRERTTGGLATWHSQTGARLRGMLELIERDAYLVTWLNQLTPRRINMTLLHEHSAAIRDMTARCARYRLRTHVLRLVTDAPTHAVCVVLEDESGAGPRYAFGLNAHYSLERAVEKAMSEAVRARAAVRVRLSRGEKWNRATRTSDIGHRDRLLYWADADNAQRLSHLLEGAEEEAAERPWDNDTETEHLQRLLAWCREKDYECISVPLTHSKHNRTTLHIEQMVMPDLQPIYLHERTQHLGGTRLTSVPAAMNERQRPAPFSDAPHPFS
jgi:ribosomal protein S12 methylthiotransferase accessory factor